MDTPPIVRQAPKRKRLAVFLDGTWNSVGDNTNVWRIKCLCSGFDNDGIEQRSYYDIGVNGLWGGVFGKGLDENITTAYEWLIDNYNDGDDIFIFGFSRGAYTARSLAGLIAICGLLKAGASLSVRQIFDRYKKGLTPRTIHQLIDAERLGTLGDCSIEDRWMLKYSQPTHIKMVGVWDTVGFLGLPFGDLKGISRSTFKYLHTGLRLPIENGYHALALDEHRRAFAPTLWTVKKPDASGVSRAPARPIADVEQRWFVGAHANVGGGYPSDLLAQPPLRWMMKKASRHGLTFSDDVDLDGDILTAPVAPSYEDFAYGLYRRVSTRLDRPIEANVVDGAQDPDPIVNETIDRSVFARWRSDPNYRPRSLAAWGARHGLDPSALDTSVMASDPAVVAAD